MVIHKVIEDDDIVCSIWQHIAALISDTRLTPQCEHKVTNVSIMDHCYLEELFGGRVFPDGTYAIDHIEEIIEHQKVFMEVVAEVRSQTMMTFPVEFFTAA